MLTETIREDDAQWLIYQEGLVTAVVDVLEAFLVGLGARLLQGNPDVAMRAMGHFGESLSQTKLAHWRGDLRDLTPTDLQKRLVGHLDEILAWLADEKMDRPDVALDDIHSAIVWLDKRGKGAGVVGPGWYRELLRGD